MPRESKGAPINSSELCSLSEKRPGRDGREEWLESEPRTGESLLLL